jgi:hypothetical protein
MQGDPETSGSVGQGGDWVSEPFFGVLPEGGDVFQMQTSASWGEVSS